MSTESSTGTISVEIHYFAAAAEAAGRTEERLDVVARGEGRTLGAMRRSRDEVGDPFAGQLDIPRSAGQIQHILRAERVALPVRVDPDPALETDDPQFTSLEQILRGELFGRGQTERSPLDDGRAPDEHPIIVRVGPRHAVGAEEPGDDALAA